MRPIIDAHLDLAWNALSFNRDLTLDLDEVNRREAHMTDQRCRGKATCSSLPELRRAGVAVCVGTLLARSGPEQSPRNTYNRTDLDFAAPAIAHAAAHGQLAYYDLLEKQGEIRTLRTRADLDDHWQQWQNADEHDQLDRMPLGLILSMEGTDPIVRPEDAEDWWKRGLRAAGLAHYGRGQHAHGTATSGPLSESGLQLLQQFQKLNIALDVTHLSDHSMAHALDHFEGPVLASHHNCRALVDGDRQLTDEQIQRLIQRDAVIGAALDAWMLYPNWQHGKTSRDVVSLDALADHIDHVCQLAGDTRHTALGTDLDGGFGHEQVPREMTRIRDLHKLADTLTQRGYTDDDLDAIFHANWLRFFRSVLPDSA